VSETRETGAAADPTRRSVLNALIGGSFTGLLGIFVYPILRFIVPPPTEGEEASSVAAAKTSELPAGKGKLFRFGSLTALVFRTQSGELRAVSAVCTHLQCLVQYRPDLELIWCACHNGRFDLTGKNVAGPPPRPLQQFAVHVRGDDVVVSRAHG